MQILISTDLGRLQRQLGRLSAHEVAFAEARAITEVVRSAERQVREDMPRTLDRPTPFTLQGPGSQGALSSNLTGRVFIRDTQAKYLALEETGGTRRPDNGSRALVIPTRFASLDSHGNLPRQAVAMLKGRRDVFVGEVRGVYGVWQRMPRAGSTAGRLRLLVAMRQSARYKPRLGFHERVRSVVTAEFPKALQRALGVALAASR